MSDARRGTGSSVITRLRAIQLPSLSAAWRRRSFPLAPPARPLGVDPAPDPPSMGIHYENEWAREYPARMARAALSETLGRGAVWGLAQPSVHGLDRLDGLDHDQPVLFVSNHHSHADTVILSRIVPQPWRRRLVVGAAADHFFEHRAVAASASLVLNAIPIERTKVSRRSSQQAEELLADGWSLMLYPEGGRSPDGWGRSFRPGAAWLAIRAEVPIVPIHIEGSGRILPKGEWLPRRNKVTINVGAPLRAEADEHRREFARRVEAAVAALADETSSDWWQARQRAARGDSPSLVGPDGAGWRRAWALDDRKSRRRSAKVRWPEL